MLNVAAMIVSLAMAIAIALFGEEPKVKPWIVAMCLACAILTGCLWLEVHVERHSMLAARVNMTAALALAGSALVSARVMGRLPASRGVILLLGIAASFNVATVWASDVYFSGALIRYPWGVYVGANPRFVVNPLIVTAIAGYAVVLVARQYGRADPLEKNRAKYLLAAFSALALSVLDYLPHFGVAPFGAPVGAMFITAFLFLFGYACLRYRLVVFRDLVGRAVGWTLSIGAMALAYGLTLEAARRGGASAMGAAPLMGAIAAVAVYASLGHALPDWTQRVLGIREPDYARAIRDFSDMITSVLDEATVRERTREICARTFDAADADYLEGSSLGPFRRHLSPPIVELEVLRRGDAALERRFDVLFPVHRRDEPVGALAVGPRSDGRMHSTHALESLRTLTNVLGIAIASARAGRDLADRLREVSVLNDELRRQVTDRSRQLGEALQRVGALPVRDSRLSIGQSIDDRYTVVRQLGAGGMGAVYEVKRATDGRHLAMKVLTAATNGTSLARLAREAEVAGKIAHPNLVSIVDVDVSRTGDLYLVMELVEGRALNELQGRFRDVPWAISILEQIAAGLAALHAGGIVHRDLKPANVLIAPGDVPKIADFGIARVADTTDPLAATIAPTLPEHAAIPRTPQSDPLTETGAVMGTPLYMAPELALGAKDAPPSSDMWSFGIVAHEILTGGLPFAGTPPHNVTAAREKALAAYGAILPPGLAELLADTLALDATLRPTARRIADELPQRAVTTMPDTRAAP